MTTDSPVLVTGATGFLGGALALRLAAEGVAVRALARDPRRGAFLAAQPGIEIIQGDILDPTSLARAVQPCRIVYHVAAALAGPIAHQRAANVTGTQQVAEAAAAARVERFVHVSSVAVYGLGYTGLIHEELPLQPGQHPYYASKAEAETVLRQVAARTGLPFAIIRPGMIYGPRSGAWTRQMVEHVRRPIIAFIGAGGGSAYPIFIEDVVDLMLVLATHPAALGEAFNCAPDPSPTWREFLVAYADLIGHRPWLGVPPPLARPLAGLAAALARPYTQNKEAVAFLNFLLSQRTYSMAKTRRLLSWAPRVSLAQGVQLCIPWLREQGLLA